MPQDRFFLLMWGLPQAGKAYFYFTGRHSVNLSPRGQVIKAAMLDLELVNRL